MYIDPRYTSPMMRIRRDVRLPDNAIGGFSVAVGQSVDIRSRIGRAMIPARHVILEAAQTLGLRDPNALANLMLVQPNTIVTRETALAGKEAKRGKRVFAPTDGLVVYVGEGRIVFQERPDLMELEAGVRGTVTTVSERRVSMETTGGLLMGLWGNGRSVIATLRLEPMSGIDVMAADTIDTAFRGEIVISSRPVTYASMEVMDTRGFAGIIAPGAEASLLPLLEKSAKAIMLTDGFGVQRMNYATYELLKEMDGFLATLNASRPTRGSLLRPELIVNRAGNQEALRAPNPYEALHVNTRVRITRDPHLGQVGRVTALGNEVELLDTGLRTMAADVLITNTGQSVRVPVLNLEAIGG